MQWWLVTVESQWAISLDSTEHNWCKQPRQKPSKAQPDGSDKMAKKKFFFYHASKAPSGKAGTMLHTKPAGCFSWGILKCHQQQDLYASSPKQNTNKFHQGWKICETTRAASINTSAFITRHISSEENKTVIAKTDSSEKCHTCRCYFTATSHHPGDALRNSTRMTNPEQAIRSTQSRELLAIFAD